MIPTIVALVLVAFLLLDLLVWGWRTAAFMVSTGDWNQVVDKTRHRLSPGVDVLDMWTGDGVMHSRPESTTDTIGAPTSIVGRLLPWRRASRQLRLLTRANDHLRRVEIALDREIEGLREELGVRHAHAALSGTPFV